MKGERIDYDVTSRTTSRKGIAFPVGFGVGGFFTKTSRMETILSGLKQLILTTKGERVMMPDFGTNLRNYVFEQFDSRLEVAIRKDILGAISKYEPRVNVSNLDINFDTRMGKEDLNSILVTLYLTSKEDPYREYTLELVV